MKLNNYLQRGYRGYFGVDFYDSEHNKKLQKANKFIDEYNSKVNTFATERENNNFIKNINKKIDKLLNT